MTLPRLTLVPLAALLAGCNKPPTPSASGPPVVESKGHDHSHDRKGMMFAEVGRYHGLLTAHPSENELDVFFETADKEPKPFAIPMTKFTAEARKDGEPADKKYVLEFEPAPEAERPKGEAAGTCSHFVAKAPWLKADDVITVSAEVNVAEGKPREALWKGFSPKTYSHDAK